MSVSKDKVQIEIEFITDSSKAFARTIQETERYKNELKKAQKEVSDLSKEEERLAAKGKDTTEVLLKKAEAEKRVNAALQGIADTSKQLQGVDLSNLLPAQLNQRATQLKQALQFIPESHPARAQMKADFDAISDKLKELNGRAKTVDKSLDDMRTTGGGMSNFFSNVFSVFLGGGLLGAVQGVFSSVLGYLKESVTAYGAAAQADGQLRASLKSTGEAAGKSFDDLTKMATDLSKVTLFDDDAIKGAESLLLTFTNIRGEVYDDALPAVLDMSQALGQDLKSSSIQLGKALNDPIQGITALSRVGVSFSDSQKATISTLVETNRVAEAQTLILKELENEFGGSAKAAAEAGLGPYLLIQKRFGEIQESIGGLMEKGLRPFAPILGNIATFFEKLTDVMVTGKDAQGEFSTAVNSAATQLKVIGNIIYIVYKGVEVAIGLWWEWQKLLISSASYVADFIKKAESFPIIGTLIKSITDPLRLVGDLLTNASATFEGFRAAAQQSIENVKNYFLNFAATAEIFGLKIAKALSFDDARNAAIDQQIRSLEAAKTKFATAGKSVGDAYSEARNNAIKLANAEAEKQEKAEAERRAKAAPLSIGGEDAKDAKKRQKEFQKELKEGFDLQIRETELFWDRERLVNEIAFQKKKRTEGEFYTQDNILQIEKYDGLIKIQNTYLARLKAGTIEYLETEKALLELEKKRAEAAANIAPRASIEVTETLTTKKVTSVSQTKTGSKLDDLKAQEALENKFLAEKFAKQAFNEIDFENQKAKIAQQYAQKRLETAILTGETEKGQIAKLNAAKLEADKNYQETIRANEKRTTDLKAELTKVQLGLASDAFSIGIDLLSQDEEARKKNSGAIKAFQIAKITLDGIQEVQAIWLNANSNPLNALIPGSGAIIAGVQTAFAVGRTVNAIGQVTAQKFAGGGFTGTGMKLQDDTGYNVAGIVHEGEYVLPKWMVENTKFQPTIAALESARVKGFAIGGFVDTTPRLSGFYDTPQSNTTTIDIEKLSEKMDKYTERIEKWATNLGVKLSIFDLEKAQYQKSVDLKDAQY